LSSSLCTLQSLPNAPPQLLAVFSLIQNLIWCLFEGWLWTKGGKHCFGIGFFVDCPAFSRDLALFVLSLSRLSTHLLDSIWLFLLYHYQGCPHISSIHLPFSLSLKVAFSLALASGPSLFDRKIVSVVCALQCSLQNVHTKCVGFQLHHSETGHQSLHQYALGQWQYIVGSLPKCHNGIQFLLVYSVSGRNVLVKFSVCRSLILLCILILSCIVSPAVLVSN
jgi:hypothetical protein